jgi:glycosidase
VSVFRYSAWEYNEIRGQFYLHQFVPGQPDLNYRNPKVMEEMLDVFRWMCQPMCQDWTKFSNFAKNVSNLLSIEGQNIDTFFINY